MARLGEIMRPKACALGGVDNESRWRRTPAARSTVGFTHPMVEPPRRGRQCPAAIGAAVACGLSTCLFGKGRWRASRLHKPPCRVQLWSGPMGGTEVAQPSLGERLRSLLLAGEKQPLWFRTMDLVLTLSASACFVLSTVQEGNPEALILRGLEDVINVVFVIGYLLLFWANDFRTSWLFQFSSVLDLASCLPVISIALRSTGDDVAAYAQLLQVFRFLRLLRETRIITQSDRTDIPVGTELFTLGFGFLGLITVSATVLYIYEEDTNEKVDSILDTLFYMTNIFTARPAPFPPETPLGKIVTMIAFALALFGIPFFVTEVTAVTMEVVDNMDPIKDENKPKKQRGLIKGRPGQRRRASGSVDDDNLGVWMNCLAIIDRLEQEERLTAEDAVNLRQLCYVERWAVPMVVASYRTASDDVLVQRLLECGCICNRESPPIKLRDQIPGPVSSPCTDRSLLVDSDPAKDV